MEEDFPLGERMQIGFRIGRHGGSDLRPQRAVAGATSTAPSAAPSASRRDRPERLPDFPSSGCAVVIGGSGGIGRAIALQLAERGCDIALNYFSNIGGAEETARPRPPRAGREVHVGQVDLRDEALVKQFVDEAGQHFGGVHTAIYAAGPYIPMRFVSQQPSRDLPRGDGA